MEALMMIDCDIAQGTSDIEAATKVFSDYTFDNPLVDMLARTGGVFTFEQAVSSWEENPFYVAMTAFGIKHIVSMSIDRPDSEPGFVTLMRNANQQNFVDDDKQILLTLRPHLEQALKVHSILLQTAQEKRIYSEAMTRLTIGTVILDGDAQVLEANQAARAIFERTRAITLQGNRLFVAKPRHRDFFSRAVSDAISWCEHPRPTPFSQALRLECIGGADIGVLVRPAPPTTLYRGRGVASAIIHLEDFSSSECVPEAIVAQLFGLTKSEARVAAMLASGLTLTDAGTKLNLTESSVRTYSKKIFAKMGVGRQADLVRLVLKSVAPLAIEEPSNIAAQA